MSTTQSRFHATLLRFCHSSGRPRGVATFVVICVRSHYINVCNYVSMSVCVHYFKASRSLSCEENRKNGQFLCFCLVGCLAASYFCTITTHLRTYDSSGKSFIFFSYKERHALPHNIRIQTHTNLQFPIQLRMMHSFSMAKTEEGYSYICTYIPYICISHLAC